MVSFVMIMMLIIFITLLLYPFERFVFRFRQIFIPLNYKIQEQMSNFYDWGIGAVGHSYDEEKKKKR